MKFPKPLYTNIKCPHCSFVGNIPFKASGNYWLGDAGWKCPQCKSHVTTTELHEENEKEVAA